MFQTQRSHRPLSHVHSEAFGTVTTTAFTTMAGRWPVGVNQARVSTKTQLDLRQKQLDCVAETQSILRSQCAKYQRREPVDLVAPEFTV